MSNHDNTIIKIRRKCDYVKISKNSKNYNKLNYSYPYDKYYPSESLFNRLSPKMNITTK